MVCYERACREGGIVRWCVLTDNIDLSMVSTRRMAVVVGSRMEPFMILVTNPISLLSTPRAVMVTLVVDSVAEGGVDLSPPPPAPAPGLGTMLGGPSSLPPTIQVTLGE